MIAPLKRGEPVAQNWRKVNELVVELERLKAQYVALLRFGRTDLAPLHPFALYNLPPHHRASPDPATDWRRVRVRAGRYLGADASGTDGEDDSPDTGQFDGATLTDEVLIAASTAAHWFWIDVTTPSAPEVKHADAAASDPDDPAGQGWTSFPVPDANHIPIGVVDSATYATDKYCAVRQYLRADVVTKGGSSVRWVAVVSYSAGNDYVTCTIDGASVKVALPWQLRDALQPSGDHSIHPAYTAGNYLAVTEPEGGTGLTVSSVPVTWLDLNACGRGWAQPLVYCEDATYYTIPVVSGVKTEI
jgi:hypothetical protein